MTIDLNTTNPLSFLDWKAYYEDISDAAELSVRYNNYLIEWKDQKQVNTNTNTNYAKSIYIQFINNLNLSTLDKNVARFIERIDTDDIYELELSIHYFTEIIQSQLKNVRDLREEVKFSTTKNKLKTSKLGIQKYVKNYIARLLSSKEFIKENTNTNISDINLEKIANAITVNLKNYISDEFVHDVHHVDRNLVLSVENKVLSEVPNVLQALSINQDGKKPKIQLNNISTPNSILSINELFTNFDRLPGRYFRGEEKTLDNLKFTHEKALIEKYIANDLYYLYGSKREGKIRQLFDNVNPTNNLAQRYNPNLHREPITIKSTDIFPYQLSFKNSGVTNFYSNGLTFNINLSTFKGREYVIPNPHKYEPGLKSVGYIQDSETGKIIRNIKIKQRTPLIFKAKSNTYKNDTQGASVDLYNNKLLRNYGYQSQENSLDYSAAGINKREDNISFWEDAHGQIDWKNTDTYPISVLNIYPESSRLDDLLITNKTGIKLRSDVYGNEFYFVKPVYPKRYAGSTYVEADSTTSSGCITGVDFYDSLYFNPLLSALSAAEYDAGNLYTSVTGVYDEFIVNDSTLCSISSHAAGNMTAWVAPLTDFDATGGGSCSNLHTQALSCGSVSATSAIDGGPFLNHPGTSDLLLTNYFNDTTVPYYTIDTSSIYSSTTTTWELSTTNQITTSAVRLFDQQFISAGEIYVRNIHTQKVDPLSTAFVNVFNKHSSGDTKSNILSTSNILDFDIIENTIYVQTSAETVTELYDFVDGAFKNNASSKSIVT